MKYSIYELICPNSKERYPFNVKYVGKTSLKGLRRLVHHLSDSCRRRKNCSINIEKDNWIVELVESFKFPLCNVFKDNLSKKEVINEESLRIKELIAMGVKLFNITHNEDLTNPIVSKSRMSKKPLYQKSIYVFNLDLSLIKKFDNISDFCEMFEIGSAMFHYARKTKTVFKHAYIVSNKSSIDLSDVNIESYRKNKVSCWSVKTRTRVCYYNGPAEAAQQLGLKHTVIRNWIKNNRIIKSKFMITWGDDIPLFPKRFHVYKDGVFLESFYTRPDTATYCGISLHTINNYICGKTVNCNGFHITKD